MDDLIIRALRPSDVEPLVAIAVAAWTPIYAWYRRTMGDELFEAAFPNWPEEKARQIRVACDATGNAIVGVAELGGHPVGFMTCYADGRSRIGEIGNNAVHPDAQGRGIGPRMYEYAFARLRERGMRYVKVETGSDPAHTPARKAYEKAGFGVQLPGVELSCALISYSQGASPPRHSPRNIQLARAGGVGHSPSVVRPSSIREEHTMSTESLASSTVCQIGLIVRDIERSIAAYADLFGVEPPGWSLTDPEEQAHTRYRGQPTAARAKLAFFRLGSVSLELIEPVGAPSTWREFLETHGEGVHHIAFTIEGMEEQLALLERKGMATVQRGDYTGGRYAYVDATPQLHVILELLENFGR